MSKYVARQVGSDYQVVNTETGQVQSAWGTYAKAASAANSLNWAAKRQAKAAAREVKANG
jgi:hypothetical protein